MMCTCDGNVLSTRLPWCGPADLFKWSVLALIEKRLDTPALQEGKKSKRTGHRDIAIRTRNEVSWWWQLFEDYGVELDQSTKVSFKVQDVAFPVATAKPVHFSFAP